MFGSGSTDRYGEEIESGENRCAAFDAEPHDGEAALCGPAVADTISSRVGKFKNPR